MAPKSKAVLHMKYPKQIGLFQKGCGPLVSWIIQKQREKPLRWSYSLMKYLKQPNLEFRLLYFRDMEQLTTTISYIVQNNVLLFCHLTINGSLLG